MSLASGQRQILLEMNIDYGGTIGSKGIARLELRTRVAGGVFILRYRWRIESVETIDDFGDTDQETYKGQPSYYLSRKPTYVLPSTGSDLALYRSKTCRNNHRTADLNAVRIE